jgi:cyclin L
VSEGTYELRRKRLTETEAAILQVLGFETRVALPHTLCVNYLQTLGVFKNADSSAATPLAKRAFAHLNSALLNPQLLYLTHQPAALATAAIYLAAREIGVKLPGDEWWEVFDTDREKLGFLVVAMVSMEGFVRQEKEKWEGRKIPLTVEELDKELKEEQSLNGG